MDNVWGGARKTMNGVGTQERCCVGARSYLLLRARSIPDVRLDGRWAKGDDRKTGLICVSYWREVRNP